MGEIVIVRHGETEWSANGRHTSVTDIPLTARGEAQARALAGPLSDFQFAAVFTSPRKRAVHTAELAGLDVTEILDGLAEWEYGEYEGITSAEIHVQRPGWYLFRDGCPGGERPSEVGARTDAVLARAAALLAEGDVCLVGHGHTSRVIGARWIRLPVAAGGNFTLDVATLSTLGHYHDRRAITRWNAP